MHLNLLSIAKKSALAALLLTSATGYAQLDNYEIGDMGYLRTPMESANGIILTNNHYSEIYSLKDNKLTSILKAQNCGLYTNLSKDGKYLGFKSFNEFEEQAPAILDVTTGTVTVLENYVWECGQPSFANDGTIAYTMGNTLIIRKGNERKAFDLGFYTNIANISPDATKVAYSNIDGRMFIINLATGAKTLSPVVDGYRAHWSPDGSKMAVQIATGSIAVQELATNKVFDLGIGDAPTWANNSEELIYTSLIRENEFCVRATEIKKVKFDGSNAITLVSSSESMPTDAILTRDNQLVVPYKTGEMRGLAVKNLATNIAPSAVKAQKVFTLGEEDVFGRRISDPNENALAKVSPIPASGTIGALDIPYLSQIYDSPAVNGCTRHGYVTCAPTTACMHLGYFKLLPTKATTNRYSGATKYYAHAISAVFTNQKGTKTFNELAYGNGCSNVPGGYGYMWTGSNSPGGGRMGTFYTLNGATSQTYTWSASTAWSWMDTEAAAGRPSPLCIALDSGGHLILGFRTNQYYRTSEGGFVARNGCFVCHDPYGDDNDATWADNDGQHSSYDWVGYNSGRANIGTFYWSIKVGIPSGSVTPVEAGIKCNPTSVTLEGEVGSTANIYKDVKVTGTGLPANMSVNSATSAITVEKLSGWNDLTGGTLRLKLNTNFTKGAGTYESYIAIQATTSYRVEFPIKVILTDPAGSTTPDPEPEPEPEPENPGTTTPVTPGTENINSLSEVWNYSETSGQSASWVVNGSQVNQDMAFKDGKLYTVYRNASTGETSIRVINAYTGAQSGTLNTTACATGVYTLSAVENLGGKIIACNLQTNIANPLIVYIWDNDSAEPRELLNTTDRPSTATRIGDAMSVSGDLNNGKIWFAFGSTVYYYTVTNGVASSTATVINLTKDGAEYTAASSPAANIYVEADGSFWLDSKDYTPTHFSASGAYIETSALPNSAASDMKVITLGSKKYAAMGTYLNLGTASTNSLANGAFILADATSGIASATEIGKYPSSGRGKATRNTSFRTSICTEVTSTNANFWVLFPNQGVAYYTFQHSSTSAVENIVANNIAVNVANKVVSISGIEVAAINIYSMVGTLVASAENTNEIDASALNGVNIVVVADKNGNISAHKVLIK